jgi:hypothetical protein
MLRIVLLGRTGNIMFQYALGRVLARKHGVPLVLDASWYNAEGWAEISHFLKLPIKARVRRKFSLASRALRNFTGKHFWQLGRTPFLKERENDQSFDPQFLDAPSDCTLFGYFQSPLYFDSMADELRAELKGLISKGARASCPQSSSVTEDELMQPTSVAVHVRRGDYLHHDCFKVCDTEYYQRSMREMRERVPGAKFFIFSDDPDWCSAHFKDIDVAAIIGRRNNVTAITGRRNNVTAITGRRNHLAEKTATGDRRYAPNPLHDLYLMSMASHHIIANSTYSWWGAWLGAKPGQQVTMPDRWYAKDIIAPIAEKKWKR